MGIKDMIARCIERMRAGACATCDNRTVCPAGRWQQAFAPPRAEKSNGAAGFFAFLGEVVETLAQPAGTKRCFKQEVEQAIEPLLGSGEVSIDRVASELGMSRQTLYRRLKAEGTTFEEVLDAKRRQLAIRYLRLDRSSVKAAAYKLGFSDPAAFSRAFKRWTGIRPSSFRESPAS
ncbi:AraC family transcriptional regulator [Sphingomonas sp.]|uniref:helix-turn-helix domain-containing protein n=1 Tax=Sphingomonas sp. TaxID=28214 RepID=UPI00183EF305|nr:AraC family transcriptional regulator [Sphingomonas sp.]MBA3510394.1 helix-turn-helix transcriptional regulator [Sphingomonas sp.]